MGLQTLADNENVMNFFLFVLEKIRIIRETKMVGAEEIDAVFFQAFQEFQAQ